MNSSGGPPSYFSRSTIVVLLISVIALYFLYGFLFSSATLAPTVLVGDEITAPPSGGLKGTDIPQPYEGGDYSFNTWVYINNFRDNLNSIKPIFELKGSEFSTLFVGLGANSNTLVVRTHSKNSSSVEGFKPESGQFHMTMASEASAADGSLAIKDRNDFLIGKDGMGTGSEPICDLPSVDLQRWVMVTVVLSGRTIDVYMDGKLTRSCVTKSYYKVDPAGVVPVILGGASSTSYSVAGLSVARFALTPGEIYRMYSSGPKANQTFTSWLVSLVAGN